MRRRWRLGQNGPAQSLVASFGNGARKDEAPVRAAIASLWSNRQTEGQITRLKLVKRQMYGRGKIDLLQEGSARRSLTIDLHRTGPQAARLSGKAAAPLPPDRLTQRAWFNSWRRMERPH